MDPVDKYTGEITEACKLKCPVEFKNYEACKDRITKKGHGDCEAWYLDYWKCIDKCRVPQFMKNVK